MAFSIRLTGFSREDGSEILFQMDLPWWRVDQLQSDARFERVYVTPGFQDYQADLSVDEVRQLNDRYKTRLATSTNPYDEPFQKQLAELEAALALGESRFSHFRALIFEWESGLE